MAFSELRSKGHESSAYIDDSALFGSDKGACSTNVTDTMVFMDELGFTIHLEKSILEPTHILVYLGFMLNSLDMTVKPTEGKVAKVKDMCQKIF